MATSLDADDEALLSATRSKSTAERAAAQRRVFELFRERVLALCIHILGVRDDAHDAVQDTFISVFRGLDGFRGEARLSTWIYQIALREALRHKARRRTSEPLDDAMVAPDQGDPALRREQRERLARALDRLSAEHRTVLSLFALEGLSHREIADVLGVPEGTIWSRVHAARKRLAIELSP
ncbi:MAG TPA: RNA polymerase sigma factor [Kofleriaceae bacterium]|nr:RNA polymerase sigma factor [Kofleriaceae bacterium]